MTSGEQGERLQQRGSPGGRVESEARRLTVGWAGDRCHPLPGWISCAGPKVSAEDPARAGRRRVRDLPRS